MRCFMDRKIRNGRVDMGTLYSLVFSMVMASSLVEAQQTPCETACAAVCSLLVPSVSSTQLIPQLLALDSFLPQGSTAQANVGKIDMKVFTNAQAFYSSLLGSYPADVISLCGTTLGQTNCAAICAPQKKAPLQAGAPAPKAAPAKK